MGNQTRPQWALISKCITYSIRISQKMEALASLKYFRLLHVYAHMTISTHYAHYLESTFSLANVKKPFCDGGLLCLGWGAGGFKRSAKWHFTHRGFVPRHRSRAAHAHLSSPSEVPDSMERLITSIEVWMYDTLIVLQKRAVTAAGCFRSVDDFLGGGEFVQLIITFANTAAGHLLP